ncbi:sugar transferase [Roseateles sp. DB2]|uniref:sugar transferase n=1 Tax=Roseateles sp. DB2 TaxID=3453717 RepID=UPI003EEDA1A6
MKRLLDVGASLVALLLLSPLLLGVALAVFAGDFGPVLFRQRRVGRDGREFSIYKFRSMVLNAERLGSFSTADGDPRITRVGRFIRRTSLDELPQLFNVLLGDMSLVGPRPDVPAQRGLYTDEEWQARHRVRPGITGLAQATLRSEATVEQRKQMDLRYAREASLALDMQIIAMTFKQVFGKGGN